MNASLRRRNRNLALLAVLSVLAYWPAIGGLFAGAWPFSDDGVTLFNVWRGLGKEALHDGALPLWNPYLFCGIPLMANNQIAILYPPNLVYWLFPMAPALLIDAILHNIWLVWGGYFLGRAWKLSRTSSFVLACTLGLSGGVAAHIYCGHLTWHAVRSWLPWSLTFLTLYLRAAQRTPKENAPRGRTEELRYVTLFAVCVAAQCASGYVPIWLVSLAFCGGLFLTWAWQRGLPQGWFSAALLAGVLSALLAAAAIVPLMEVSRLSEHGDGLNFASSSRASGTWTTWARLLVPGFFGNNRVPQWSIPYVPHEEVGYIGILPLLLALGAPFFVRRFGSDGKVPMYIWLLMAVLPFTAVMALGFRTPLYRFAYDFLPLVHKTRVPVRWMELFYYAAAILCAFSFEALLHRRHAAQVGGTTGGQEVSRAVTLLLRVFAVFCLLCGALVAAVALTPSDSAFWLRRVQDNTKDFNLTPQVQMQFAQMLQNTALGEALITLVFCGCACYVLWKWVQAAPPQRRQYEKLLLLLIVFDLSSYFWRSAHLVSAEAVKNSVDLPAALIQREYDKEQRWEVLLDSGSTNMAALHHLAIFNGYDALSQKHYGEFVSAIEGKPTWAAHYEVKRHSPLLRVASLSKSIASPGRLSAARLQGADFQPRLIANEGLFQLWQWNGAWPRAYVTRNLHRVAEHEQLPLLEKLARADFTAQNRPAVVAPGAFSEVAVQPLTERDAVTEWNYDWNRVTLKTRASAPSLLVFNDVVYPGWTAAVNGQKVPMESANFLFRGVAVPAGEATVQMVYEPQTVRVALFLSLCGLTALCALAVTLFTGTKRRTARPLQ